MKHTYYLICLLVLLLFSCKKEDAEVENTPLKNYTVLWEDFNSTYPAFQLNNINWDSVYAANTAKISSNTTDSALFNILNSSILTLKDAHSDIISKQYGATDYYDVFIRQKPANFISWNVISSKYVQVIKSNNHNLAYGKVKNQDIGYFFIASFNDNQNDYYFIDSFLEMFQNSKGIIIDVRQNGGGNEYYGQIVASRLTNQAVTYRYARYRSGPGHSDLSDGQPLVLNPDGNLKFTKTVVLLTNRRTFSAAEDFTLMLRSLANVVQIGDTTFGGVATNPVIKTLPNGWKYRMARALECDKNKIPIKGGIAPHIAVQISKSDSVNGLDKIIETAINTINDKQQ